MSDREQLVSATERCGIIPAAPLPATTVGPTRGSSAREFFQYIPLWEELFPHVPPAQQQELLTLAGRQGLLYAHQLPVLTNGNGARTLPHVEEPASRQVLARIVAGHTNDLQPVRALPLQVEDTALDAAQREAVARALNTPDVCLIQGLPGTGKSRVVAEIVSQATAREMRVLLLAPTGAALDRVLALVDDKASTCPVRCVGPDEQVESLTPDIRAFTFTERARILNEQSLAKAQAALTESEHRCRYWRELETIWPRLWELLAQGVVLNQQLEALEQQHAACADAVAAEAREIETGPAPTSTAPSCGLTRKIELLAESRRKARARLETELAEIGQKTGTLRQEMDARAPALAEMQSLADAKRTGRWWTARWWRATWRGNVARRLAELESLQTGAGAALDALAARERALTQDGTDEQNGLQAELARLLGAEVERRQGELAARAANMRCTLAQIQEEWRAQCLRLDDGACLATPLTDADLRAAFARWQLRLSLEESQLQFARDWVVHLQHEAGTLTSRLPRYINLIAATTTGLEGDAHFGERSPLGQEFDLLVLEEADQVTESEFLRLARLARRWILVGSGLCRARKEGEGVDNGVQHSARQIPRADLFLALWHHLHSDPRRLPYRWVREKDRLCCRLRPLSPDQLAWLESERVADFPDIELRILVLPRMQPLLVQVVFPSAMSIAQAKAYIFKELQELPVQATGHSFRWLDRPDQIALAMGAPAETEEVPVQLEVGVREIIAKKVAANHAESPAQLPWQTLRLEFDHEAGWSRERAEEWVRRYLGIRDLGRTICLDVPYRMQPRLAACLSEMLFDGAYVITNGAEPRHMTRSAAIQNNDACGRVELVTVPPLAAGAPSVRGSPDGVRKQSNGRRAAVSPRRPALPGGAGLELDLAAPSQVGRLPSELRAELPARGLVNYLEAQAVVHALENVVTRRSLPEPTEAVPAVAVLALYPAQASLIRCLMRRSAVLAGRDIPVEVDVPGAFRHREAPIVLVSLTRSHTHRAVSFGEDPGALPLALTRARAQLILFGDPGTLGRRSQWEGPLDHLDALEAERERRLIAAILRHRHGHDSLPGSNSHRKGSGA
jgi:hypothetical protein